MLIVLVAPLLAYVGMSYGPLAAYLAELYPCAIRYSSLSLPYLIGLGYFDHDGRYVCGTFLPDSSALAHVVRYPFAPRDQGQGHQVLTSPA
jgi:hypothetical protein